MTTRTSTSTYPLRLPRSLRDAVEKLSREHGTSINQFVVMAVAEKVGAMTTARFFTAKHVRTWRRSTAFSTADAASRRGRGMSCPCRLRVGCV